LHHRFTRPGGGLFPRGVVLPDAGFGKAQNAEIFHTARRIVGAIELVELRWWHGRAGQHRVGLPAVVDLVLEQVRQQAVHRLGVDAGSARHIDDAFEQALVERDRLAQRDQFAVERTLRLRQFGAALVRLFGVEEAARIGVRRLAAQAVSKRWLAQALLNAAAMRWRVISCMAAVSTGAGPGSIQRSPKAMRSPTQRSRSNHICRISASVGVRNALGSSMVTTGTPLCTPP